MVIKSIAHVVLRRYRTLNRFARELRLKVATYLLLLVFIALAVQGCTKKDDGPVDNTTSSVFETPAVSDIVMYEVNPGAFSATKNLQGVTNRLDQIKALGVNTIWLMPIYPIGILKSFGSPYCVRNYTEVNPDLGTMQDLQTLVSEAHKRNMAVILDWVANHTSWDNPWISNPSMLAAYTTLLNFYDSSVAARKGSLTTYGDRNVVVFQKTSGTEHVLVVVNVRALDETYTLPMELQGEWTDALAGTTITLGTSIPLTPYQYYVLKR